MDRALDPQANRLHEAGYGALITLASTVPFEVTQHPPAAVDLTLESFEARLDELFPLTAQTLHVSSPLSSHSARSLPHLSGSQRYPSEHIIMFLICMLYDAPTCVASQLAVGLWAAAAIRHVTMCSPSYHAPCAHQPCRNSSNLCSNPDEKLERNGTPELREGRFRSACSIRTDCPQSPLRPA